MRQDGLVGVVRGKTQRTTLPGGDPVPAADLVKRRFGKRQRVGRSIRKEDLEARGHGPASTTEQGQVLGKWLGLWDELVRRGQDLPGSVHEVTGMQEIATIHGM